MIYNIPIKDDKKFKCDIIQNIIIYTHHGFVMHTYVYLFILARHIFVSLEKMQYENLY